MHLVSRDFLTGRKVLVVDDSADNRAMLKMFLHDSGCTIDTVSNGAEAVDITDISKFDLIMMDLHMPVMDGLSAAVAIRKSTFDGFIIAITATDSSEIRTVEKSAVFDKVLRKPISKALLLTTLSELIPHIIA